MSKAPHHHHPPHSSAPRVSHKGSGGYGGLFVSAMGGAALGAFTTWYGLRMGLNSKFKTLMTDPRTDALQYDPSGLDPNNPLGPEQVARNTQAIQDLKNYIAELHKTINALFWTGQGEPPAAEEVVPPQTAAGGANIRAMDTRQARTDATAAAADRRNRDFAAARDGGGGISIR